MLTSFRTHKGRVVVGKRLQDALDKVARDWARMGRAIYRDDDYAAHVSKAEKIANLRRMLITAHRIRTGQETGFWLWQDINHALTGECIALLPKWSD